MLMFGPVPRTPLPAHPIIAPAFTVQFAIKGTVDSTLPPHTHFADLISPNHAVVVSQDNYMGNALVGGLIVARMQALGVPVVVVNGRVRDIPEFQVPVYSRGTSTLAAGAYSTAVAVGTPVRIGFRGEEGRLVYPGDIVFADSQGVVIIPKSRLREVVGWVKVITGADEKVMADVKAGRKLYEALKEHRGA